MVKKSHYDLRSVLGRLFFLALLLARGVGFMLRSAKASARAARYRQCVDSVKTQDPLRIRFLNNFPIHFDGQPYISERRLRPSALVVVGEVLKFSGLFAEARFVLKLAAKTSGGRLHALLAIGDLELALANWRAEFLAYWREGIAIELEHDPLAHSRSIRSALEHLRIAISDFPESQDARWLYALAEWRAGNADKACQLLEETGIEFTIKQRLLKSFILLDARKPNAIDYANGAVAALGWKPEIAELCDAEDLRGAESNYSAATPAVRVSTRSVIVSNGKLHVVTNAIELRESGVAEIKDAILMPAHGVVRTGKGHIVRQTSHVHDIHLNLFTPHVQHLSGRHALVCAPEPTSLDGEGFTYIGGNSNYYHWLLEELPRLCLLPPDYDFKRHPIIAPADAAHWQFELLERVAPSAYTVRADLAAPRKVQRLIVPTRLSQKQIVHPVAVNYLRERFNINDQTKGDRRIYITRRGAAGRSLLNEDALLEVFRAANFEVVDPSSLSLESQIRLFSSASIIAGPAGAAFANMIFAPAGAKILLLAAAGMICETFTSIAMAAGQHVWIVAGPSLPRPTATWIWTPFDFMIDEKDIRLALQQIL